MMVAIQASVNPPTIERHCQIGEILAYHHQNESMKFNFFFSDIEAKDLILNVDQGPLKANSSCHDPPPSTSQTPASPPHLPHIRHTVNKLNHIQLNESDFSGDSSGGYNYTDYNLPLIQHFTEPHEEYHQPQNGAYEFYSDIYSENSDLTNIPNAYPLNYPTQTQRPFSASSSSCSSIESSELVLNSQQQYNNYTNLISFYGQNSNNQNGRPVMGDSINFNSTFGRLTPTPTTQGTPTYTSVIVDNTQQFNHHGGGLNEFVH